jgi:hypothetical protein
MATGNFGIVCRHICSYTLRVGDKKPRMSTLTDELNDREGQRWSILEFSQKVEEAFIKVA